MSELAMGTGEGGTQSKDTNPYSSLQEQPTTPAYPDWANSFQAYYGPGVTPPPPYFASPVASGPTPPPYMWGGQPIMTPYGTAPPYAAVYTHGGIYTHPSLPPGAHSFSQYSAPSAGNPTEVALISVPSGIETEAKSLLGKGRNSIKKVKGNLEKLQIVSTKGGSGKATSNSASGAFSQSGGSGSEGSTEGSEEDNSQTGCETGRKRSLEPLTMNGTNATDTNNLAYNAQIEAKTTMNRSAMGLVPPAYVPGRSAVNLPTTNLNIGMDVWNRSAPGSATPVKGRQETTNIVSALVPTTAQLMPGRDGVPSELLVQDERELKRQKRKQSNRESAKRSRMKKQLECEELTAKVETLTAENTTLRNELNLIAQDSEKLASENELLKEKLMTLQGEDRVGGSERNGPRRTQSQFMQPAGNNYPQVLSKISNSSSNQRDEQRDSEISDLTGKGHAVLESNARSDTVAAG